MNDGWKTGGDRRTTGDRPLELRGDRRSSQETGEERQTPGGAAGVTSSLSKPEFRGAIIRLKQTIPSELQKEKKVKKKKI
ncbi:Hypothetical predicted protein [Scomber scombrus]|uniref:Uncharacterized protein n=1 Tax=Scomber scombrus TaxID=13677 RepID=A0AAV1Q8K3_SCOSC